MSKVEPHRTAKKHITSRKQLEDYFDQIDPALMAEIEAAIKAGPPTGPPPPSNHNWCGNA